MLRWRLSLKNQNKLDIGPLLDICWSTDGAAATRHILFCQRRGSGRKSLRSSHLSLHISFHFFSTFSKKEVLHLLTVEKIKEVLCDLILIVMTKNWWIYQIIFSSIWLEPWYLCSSFVFFVRENLSLLVGKNAQKLSVNKHRMKHKMAFHSSHCWWNRKDLWGLLKKWETKVKSQFMGNI